MVYIGDWELVFGMTDGNWYLGWQMGILNAEDGEISFKSIYWREHYIKLNLNFSLNDEEFININFHLIILIFDKKYAMEIQCGMRMGIMGNRE